ncbi:aldo/keto reductase [Paenibacillus nasutitermitis]|uniref:Aldo/keto reductase n=1 Tax=Paenibacillus nasutitermitis TaxID=1652958 RepID=A0A916ZAM8_9BACL|nr:aldo/keto reductase [Paenibacillus nasutitermitis]GGD83189.1 aldo/keto reductase [Paenibacillus nasutitermitis]
MEKRKFGRTDMQVSVLGFGAAEIGMKSYDLSQKEADLLLHTALEQGINVIDTASSYKSSEALLGNALAGRRSDYYLFSKCGEGTSVGLDYPDWDARNVRPSVERSLSELKTDYLDLVLIHSCSEAILRQGDLIAAVQKLKEDGLVRYIGYSGDSTDALYAIRTDIFDALETSINVADQQAISLTLKEAQTRQMGIIAKRPIANAVWMRQGLENAPDPYIERLAKLDFPFLQGDKDKITEIALRFVLSVPQVDTAIVGTTKPEHLLLNVLHASNGALSGSEMDMILNRWKEVAEPAWAGLT